MGIIKDFFKTIGGSGEEKVKIGNGGNEVTPSVNKILAEALSTVENNYRNTIKYEPDNSDKTVGKIGKSGKENVVNREIINGKGQTVKHTGSRGYEIVDD